MPIVMPWNPDSSIAADGPRAEATDLQDLSESSGLRGTTALAKRRKGGPPRWWPSRRSR